MARKAKWTADWILKNLKDVELVDRDFIATARSIREELHPGLEQALWERDGVEKVNAAALLLRIGFKTGNKGLIECLRSGDAEVQRHALYHMSMIVTDTRFEGGELRTGLRAPLDIKTMYSEVKPFIKAQGSLTGSHVLRAMMGIPLPEAEDAVRELLHHPDVKIQEKVIWWMAQRGEDGGAIGAAEKLLLDDTSGDLGNYWAIAALEKYCAQENEDHRQRAAQILARFVDEHINIPDIAGQLQRMLKGLKEANYLQERTILEKLFNSEVNDWRRGLALKRLAEIDGMARANDLIAALADPILRSFAAQGIEAVTAMDAKAKERFIEPLVQAIFEAIKDANDEHTPSTLRKALVAIGGDETKALEELAGTFSPEESMQMYWKANGISFKQAVSLLSKEGIIRKSDPKLLRELEEEWIKEENPFGIVLTILDKSRRLLWFDSETDVINPDYEELLTGIANICRPNLNLDRISQANESEGGGSDVIFYLNDKEVKFRAGDFGDYYDIAKVLTSLNTALEELKSKERFVLLYTGDQTCLMTFGPLKGFQQAEKDILLPLAAESLELIRGK